MVYVMSDLHGCKKHYDAMLKKIKFSEEDQLFLLGDLIDRGAEPIPLLLDVMERENVTMLLGNHEYAFLHYVDKLRHTPMGMDLLIQPQKYFEFQIWKNGEGQSTSEQFLALHEEKRAEVLEYLRELEVVKEIEIGKKTWVLMHGGLGNFAPTKELKTYSIQELVQERVTLDTRYFEDKTVLLGHTPTSAFGAVHKGRIFKTDTWIDLDCGTVFSGTLGCLCLDSMEEFYVSEHL